MKTLRNLSFVLLLTLGLTSFGLAQENADVNVSATVNAALQLTPGNIDLGTIQTGAASYIQANTNDATAETNLGAAATAGSLQIQGDAGANVIVTWGDATVSNGTDDLTFTPTVFNGSTEVSSGASLAISGGDVTLDIGGALTAPTGTGSYNTTTDGTPITFTVAYE